MYQYFAVNKPTNMLSQFIKPGANLCLSDLSYQFPEGIHAIGRLDKNTQGLILLTNNPKVTQMLFDQNRYHKRTYLVQVIRIVSDETIQQLSNGITIYTENNLPWVTSKCEVSRVTQPELLFSITNYLMPQAPHTWLKITLQEGKFHQIKKMVRMAGHPCRQLIRLSVENIEVNDEQVTEMSESDFFTGLNIR